ncbi:hypothetical protein ES708_12690 [subsurface metagenome]
MRYKEGTLTTNGRGTESQHKQTQPARTQEELIEITEELKTAQEQALAEERRLRQMMEASREEGKYNFRDYDQS